MANALNITLNGTDWSNVTFNPTSEVMTSLRNDTSQNDTASGPVAEFPQPFPMHSLVWRLGLIFVTSGLLIFFTFLFLVMLKYTRRRMKLRARRRRVTRPPFAYDNPQDVGDPQGTQQGATVGQTTGRGGVGAREDHTHNELDDGYDSGPPGLDQARLAFNEDPRNYMNFSTQRNNIL